MGLVISLEQSINSEVSVFLGANGGTMQSMGVQLSNGRLGLVLYEGVAGYENNGLFISIHEANLVDYSSMTLSPKGKGSLEVELYPWSDGIKVKSDNGIKSSWRTIHIADNSSGLLESNLILNLNVHLNHC